MATRGFVGFVAGKAEKIAYNHDDSYPAGVGLGVLAWLHAAMRAPDLLRQRIVALRVVSPDSWPTADDIERLSTYAGDPACPSPSLHWWELLWQTQGDVEKMLQAGVIVDASDFPVNSSHCEWGYVIDLDVMVFEVYRGQQLQPHNRGRFVTRQSLPGQWPVALLTGWPLNQLPGQDEFLDALASTC
ncbi:hypothetical protein [Nonomuraea aridisoli]|uniref:hypothetical protein n=1 Tax=Nonomuraea aridisoli TaxID=2070368 RepID=UPI0011B9486F|nr:hypothetical protein [Nonomuraea aridisoli]